MKVDSGGYPSTVLQAADDAEAAERGGFDGYWAPEIKFDALIGCAVAATRTRRIDVGTSITVAFARNPMTVAQQANDLQLLSGGRFLLGLGSQIKPHITRRFSMPWSHPAPRMAEFIRAIRAIWGAWETGDRLSFEGQFYTHTLMTPFFNPGSNSYGNPPILLAGVGATMTETAGEVADGFVAHGFQTERYMREVTIPALTRGRARVGKTLEGFDVSMPVFSAVGDTEEQRHRGLAAVRGQIGFYGSTPAYRPVLELHGWSDLHYRLNAMTKEGAWARLAEIIPDEVIDAFAVIGTAEEVVSALKRRFGGILTRVTLQLPSDLDPDRRSALLETLRSPCA